MHVVWVLRFWKRDISENKILHCVKNWSRLNWTTPKTRMNCLVHWIVWAINFIWHQMQHVPKSCKDWCKTMGQQAAATFHSSFALYGKGIEVSQMISMRSSRLTAAVSMLTWVQSTTEYMSWFNWNWIVERNELFYKFLLCLGTDSAF